MSGKRYPLVIQTHGWNPHRFWVDGAFPTPFAAQALAGKGIMVLQANEDYSAMDTLEEVDREVASLKGAIDYLDARSLIDRARVGVIGFSRSGLYVRYALTHWDYQFAAASVTDDFSAGYFSYIAFGNGDESRSKSFEGVNGGLPVGEGLRSWLKRSPGFNVNKVRAPLRILALNPGSLMGEWEWFALLRRLGKPVELTYIKDSDHVSQRPLDRMVAQQGNVDWFDFWLNGHEDPDPAKAEQYARWRELRKLQKQNETKSREAGSARVH